MTIAVIGGGITGLTAAWRLTQLGHSVRVFEKAHRIGGSISTRIEGGWLSEGGPNSILDDGAEVAALIEELGLGAARLEVDPAARNRYVVRGGKLVAAPASPAAILRNQLLSPGARWRILTEFFRGKRTEAPDISVADFARNHFGEEVLAYLVRPFVSGVFSGDADLLSLRRAFPKIWAAEQKHGSALKGLRQMRKEGGASGQRPRVFSFGHGLQVLVAGLDAQLKPGSVHLGTAVDRLIPGAGWTVTWRSPEGLRADRFDKVVLTVPAHALAGLLIGAGRDWPLAGLASIPTPPVSSLFLGFKRGQVAHPLDGFGVLVPPVEKRRLLGVVFSSSLFLGRAPAGHVGITVMTGGALQPQMALSSGSELWRAVRSDLHELLGVEGEPVYQRLSHWPEGIPQYNLGHDRHLETMAACERNHPGLLIGGNARDGISVPDCIRSGLRLAAAAAA